MFDKNILTVSPAYNRGKPEFLWLHDQYKWIYLTSFHYEAKV